MVGSDSFYFVAPDIQVPIVWPNSKIYRVPVLMLYCLSETAEYSRSLQNYFKSTNSCFYSQK